MNTCIAPPREVFPAWEQAQREAAYLAREPLPAPWELRTTGLLSSARAQAVSDWFTGEPTPITAAVHASYRALAHDTERLWQVVRRALGVRVQYTHGPDDPYLTAAELCTDLRRHGTIKLRTIACDDPHPLLGGEQGGIVDRLRAVHDVFGHAALGLGFDLQAEYATWLQCRSLFSPPARPAAFCELVGAVTAYVMTGQKPALRAALPPPELQSSAAVLSSPREVIPSLMNTLRR